MEKKKKDKTIKEIPGQYWVWAESRIFREKINEIVKVINKLSQEKYEKENKK